MVACRRPYLLRRERHHPLPMWHRECSDPDPGGPAPNRADPHDRGRRGSDEDRRRGGCRGTGRRSGGGGRSCGLRGRGDSGGIRGPVGGRQRHWRGAHLGCRRSDGVGRGGDTRRRLSFPPVAAHKTVSPLSVGHRRRHRSQRSYLSGQGRVGFRGRRRLRSLAPGGSLGPPGRARPGDDRGPPRQREDVFRH